MNREKVNKWTLLVVVLLISALFLTMIRQFLIAIFLAGIFSALSFPMYRRFENWFSGRRVPASAVTIVVLVCVILVPLAGLLGIVANQAVKVATVAKPWIEHQISEPGTLSHSLQSLPFYDTIEPYQKQILSKAGELAGSTGKFIMEKLTSATMGTFNIIIDILIMLYCMFFFLTEGDGILKKILYYLPLEDHDERRILDKFTSITRATIKGTLVIGVLQGGLAGLAFAVLGIHSAVFWGTVMAVLSVIPSVGSALVWFPAVIYLAATGHIVMGIGLFVFCAFVVGSLDNLLRPKLVGKDTQMHELMILFGTLGGIFMFGIVGIIIGPIVAGLFVTIWEIYGIAFQDVLPEVKLFSQKEEPETLEEENKATGDT
ncbi:MAG: AI-2E family transporter [Deltaproteobacteria bacterium]|nr:AI-2E family transporter [Deltaproteobacteria bacterium]